MKTKSFILTLALGLFLFGVKYTLANEGHEHQMPTGTMMDDDMSKGQMDSKSTKAVEIGNKVCPVTGNRVDDGSMGEMVKYEYKGKIYNLCCNMCKKDFMKDPQKYSKIAEDEAKGTTMHKDKKAGHKTHIHANGTHHDHSK